MGRRIIHARKKPSLFMNLDIRPTRHDHQAMVDQSCSNPRACRWNVATHRAAEAMGMGPATKVWVDAGHIKFTMGGWRWVADTPKAMKADLIALDKWLALAKAKRETTPPPFDPRTYKVEFERKHRQRKTSAEELAKMAKRRAARIARGEPDKPHHRYTFHERVVGYA